MSYTKEDLIKWSDPNGKREEILALINEADSKLLEAMHLARESGTPVDVNLTALENVLQSCRFVPRFARDTAPESKDYHPLRNAAYQRNREDFQKKLPCEPQNEYIMGVCRFIDEWRGNGGEETSSYVWESSSSNC
jgi:hypothetical protein